MLRRYSSSQLLSHRYLPIGLFLAARLMFLAALPLEGLRGYGDFVHFYRLAGMGWPFLDYWVEFPPIFPFLSAVLFRLAGGREHVYDYLLAMLLTLAEAGALAGFLRLTFRLHGTEEGARRGWCYFGLIVGLAYGWWFFDSLALLTILWGLNWLLDGRDRRAGFVLSLGMLVKWFPVLALASVWRFRSVRRAAVISAVALGTTFALWTGLFLASPELTRASLRSQGSKGSWETVWALLDGNLHTGNFGPEIERYDPATAALPRGNPARIPPLIALPFFAAMGGLFFIRAKPGSADRPDAQALVAFLGLTWCLFLLWTPGYSPQWVLYLLPLILLTLPGREAILMAITLTLVNLLEWPILLSRGYFWGLWLTIPLRTLLLLLLTFLFWRVIEK